jgi:hypothetical protein
MFRQSLFLFLTVLGLAAISSAQPWINITTPNGGENWILGSLHNITWTDNISGNLRIDLYRGSSLETVIAGGAPNSGNYTWHLPTDISEGENYKIKMSSVSDPSVIDWSDDTFTLSQPPSIQIVKPNGGESWCVGDSMHISWTSVNMGSEDVRIDIKHNYPNGLSWTTIASSAPNDGDYVWVVSGPGTTTARVRIRGVTHLAVGDTSDAGFTIIDSMSPPTVVIHTDGDSLRLTWTPVLCADYYRITVAFSEDGPYSLMNNTPQTFYMVDFSQAEKLFFRIIAGN